jgi:MscS family membrane protein
MLKSFSIILFTLLFSFHPLLSDENPLTPIRFHSPHDTLKEFLNNMNDYKKGREKNDEKLIFQINKAIQALDSQDINPIIRDEKAKEAAILLKETLDRVYVPDFKKIPNHSGENNLLPIVKWTVPDTEITIVRIEEGPRAGEFLFSSETVQRANEFFHKTRHLPFLEKNGKRSRL